MFQKRALAVLSLIVAVASPLWAQSASTARRAEVGRDMGGVGARPVSVGKSVRAARSEIRVSRPREGRRRSVVPVDREAGLVGRSLSHPAREHVRHADRSPSTRSTSASPSTGGNIVKGTNRPVLVRRTAQRQHRRRRLGYSDACRPEAAGRRADRRTQARRLVSRHRAERPDDVARQGAADVISQPPAIGRAHSATKTTPHSRLRRRRGISSTRLM